MRKVLLALVILLAAAAAWELSVRATRGQALAVGIALVAAGVPLLLLARLNLGKAFSIAPRATTVVDRGLYSKIPHPMFTFLDVALLGVVIALRQRWLVAAWLVLVCVHALEGRREARLLERTFGDAYRKYRAQTWW